VSTRVIDSKIAGKKDRGEREKDGNEFVSTCYCSWSGSGIDPRSRRGRRLDWERKSGKEEWRGGITKTHSIANLASHSLPMLV